jgi:hypothetical protein
MIKECANPACSVPLRYLRDGRLFQFEVRSRSSARKVCRQVAHFWLCGQCSRALTLVFDPLSGVQVVPTIPLQTLPILQVSARP